jgi:hypothetical protein
MHSADRRVGIIDVKLPHQTIRKIIARGGCRMDRPLDRGATEATA